MERISNFDLLNESWSREKILLSIKNGENSNKIVNKFIDKNKENLEEVSKIIFKFYQIVS